MHFTVSHGKSVKGSLQCTLKGKEEGMKQKANFYVSIPKDFGQVKTSVAFGLTLRQLICFGGAAAIGVPAYLLLKNYVSNDAAMLIMIAIMAPWFAFALYTKDGLPLEKVIKNVYEEKILRKKIRPVRYDLTLDGVEQIERYKNTKSPKKRAAMAENNKNRLFGEYISHTKGPGTIGKLTGRKSKNENSSPADSLPFESINENGVMHIAKDKYSICFAFSDINYEQANVSNQKDIWSDWCMLLNSFDTDCEYQFVYYNKYADIEETAEKLKIEMSEDEKLNLMIGELNDHVRGILSKGNNGMEKQMYLVVSFNENSKKVLTTVDEIKDRISNEFEEKMGIEGRWLDGYEWLSALFYMLNPYREEKFLFSWDPIVNGGLSDKEMLLNHGFAFGKTVDTFRAGNKVGCVSYLKVMSNKISDRFLAEFLNIDSEIIVSFHVKALKQDKSLKLVKKLLSDLQKNVIDEQKGAVNQGFSMNNISPGLKRNVEAAEELLDNVSMDDEKLFYVTITMVQFADTNAKLTRNFNAIKAIASAQTCEMIRLDHQQEKGYFSTLPFGENQLEINRLYTTTSLGVFLPFKIKELLQFGESLCIGYNKITGNIIMADIKKLQNPNMIVLGKPGRGKSFFVKMMLIQVFLKTKDDILICDPEGEYHPLVNVLNGQMIKLCAGSNDHINPLDISLDAEDFEIALVDKATFVMSMFEQILKGKGQSDPQDRSIIDRALRKIYKPFMESLDEKDIPVFTDLYMALREEESERAAYLADTFEVYSEGSLNFFNHRTNIDMNNRVVCFDIRDLSNELKNLGMLFVQETVWGRVSANREKKKYTRYFIDEFHVLLRDPQTAAYSRDIWKRFRKWLGMPCGITQNVTDLMSSPEIKTIFDNSDCYVILGQDENEAAMLGEELNLTEKQKKCISTRNGGEGLFIYGADVMPYVGRIPTDGMIYKTITTRYAEE